MAGDPRTEPPLAADERRMLDGWLDFHRATLAVKCDGLTDDQLRERSVPPSSLSLLGLVRHMGEVERNWFRNTLRSENAPLRYCSADNPDGDFDDVAAADAADAFDYWHAECEHARQAAAAAESLDVTGERRGEVYSLRWIMVHMIEEYARHNGHADFLRERIDGATGS